MQWQTASDYKLPDKTASAADFILAYDVRSDLTNADLNFLSGTLGPQYASPEAYIEAMIVWAQSIQHFGNFAPPNWNPTQAAILASFSCFDMLKKMRVNATSDQSIYDAWTGVPVVPLVAPTSDGTNVDTGPSSVQAGTILGGTKK